jgi:hypothetical protein
MAINVEIIQSTNSGREGGFRNNDIQLPANAVTNITAAGVTAFTAGTRRVKVRNRTGGDSVYVLVQLASASATAAAGTGLHLAAGQELNFSLPKNGDASTYEIDIRAAA